DHFHKNANNIYHLYFNTHRAKQEELSGSMPTPLLPALKASFPEVKMGTRIINSGGIITYKDKKIFEEVKYADADFLQMFSFPFIKGNAKTALSELNNVVLREGTAKAIFGKEDPINKVLQIQINDEWKPFVVSAILAEFPDNSSINYDLILRFENNENYSTSLTRWDNTYHDIYVQVAEGTKSGQFEKKLLPFVSQNFKEDIEKL
ncbi:MAG: hypothetical protein JWQ09_648, partial [Segetibacter sp.]|nr:hypothetical protein [Segetibacter sp.]